MRICKLIYCSLPSAFLLFILLGCSNSSAPSVNETPAYIAAYEKEVENAKRLVQGESGERASLKQLAKLYHANGKLNEAIQCYRRLCEIDSKDPRWPHLLANLLAGYGRLDEAMPYQLLAVELAPELLAPSLRLAGMFQKLNKIEEAEELYKSIHERDPNNPYALLGLARCDISKGNWDLARDRLERSVFVDKNFVGGWGLLSTVLEELGQGELSRIARMKSFGRYVDFPDPWLNDLTQYCYDPYQLSVAAAVSTELEVSIALVKQAIALDPFSSSYYRQLGNLLQKDGDTESARIQFELAVEVDPEDSESWAALIHLMMNEQDYDSVNVALEKSLSLCSDSAYLHFVSGRRYVMVGLYQKAKMEFEEAKRIQPHEGRSYVQLSMLYLMQGDIQKAKNEVEVARSKEPSNPEIYVMLTKISILSGKRFEARRWLNALQAIPNHSKEDFQILTQEYKLAFK